MNMLMFILALGVCLIPAAIVVTLFGDGER